MKEGSRAELFQEYSRRKRVLEMGKASVSKKFREVMKVDTEANKSVLAEVGLQTNQFWRRLGKPNPISHYEYSKLELSRIEVSSDSS